MRHAFTALGAAAIAAYAVGGAFVMNDLAVVAASGLPFDVTVEAMAAAGQPYSPWPGMIFAGLGLLLALAWAALSVVPSEPLPGTALAALWGGILALGAPAYFFSSFANLNAVGDTFADWNSEAAFAREAPIYLAGACGLLVVVIAAVLGVAARVRTRDSQPAVS